MTTHADGLADPHAAARRAFLGNLIADAIAMPVHWYYNQQAIDRDYPELAEGARYLAPRNPHADSILWRSSYTASNEKGEILHDQARYWGERGVHYHQFLVAGENTLNFQLAVELHRLVTARRDYDPEQWLDHYVAFMRTPGRHRDTYVEEYHRHFFTNHAAGRKPINCGVRDVHIGGLVPVPALVAALGPKHHDLRRIVRLHVGLTHKDDGVIEAADILATILSKVCQGQDLRETILAEASDWISAAKVETWSRHPDRMVVGGMLSSACYIPDAFPAALYLAWKHADDFAGGVGSNALCGGDNCHRGAVVGSLLGASRPIPHELVNGLVLRDRV
ncbi:MAG: ADP-ribosylglycohydrolase family protein [Planctomycetia bacterium]